MNTLYEKDILEQIKNLDKEQNEKSRFDNKILSLISFDLTKFKEIIFANVKENNISYILEEFKEKYEYQESQNDRSEQIKLETAFKYIFMKIFNFMEIGKILISLDDKEMNEIFQNQNLFSIFVVTLRNFLENKSINEKILKNFFEVNSNKQQVLENIYDETKIDCVYKHLLIYFIQKYKETVMYSKIEYNSFGHLDNKKDNEEVNIVNENLENLKQKFLKIIEFTKNLVKEYKYLEKFNKIYSEFEEEYFPSKIKVSNNEKSSQRRGALGENEIKKTLNEIGLNDFNEEDEKLGKKRIRSPTIKTEFENSLILKPKKNVKDNEINSRLNIKHKEHLINKRRNDQKDNVKIKKSDFKPSDITNENVEEYTTKESKLIHSKKENRLNNRNIIDEEKIKKEFKLDENSTSSRRKTQKVKVETKLTNTKTVKKEAYSVPSTRNRKEVINNNLKIKKERISKNKSHDSSKLKIKSIKSETPIKKEPNLDKSFPKLSNRRINNSSIKNEKISLLSPKKENVPVINSSNVKGRIDNNNLKTPIKNVTKSPEKILKPNNNIITTPPKILRSYDKTDTNKILRETEMKLIEMKKRLESLKKESAMKKLNLTPTNLKSHKKIPIENSSLKKMRTESIKQKKGVEILRRTEQKLDFKSNSIKKKLPIIKRQFIKTLNESVNKKKMTLNIKKSLKSSIEKARTTRKTIQKKVNLNKLSLNTKLARRGSERINKKFSKKRERKQVKLYKS